MGTHYEDYDLEQQDGSDKPPIIIQDPFVRGHFLAVGPDGVIVYEVKADGKLQAYRIGDAPGDGAARDDGTVAT